MPTDFPYTAPPLESPSGALVSRLTGDPDMTDLIEMFVAEIPERIKLVEDYWARRDLGELRRIAHQLKGACGGYGFPEIGRIAGTLEERLARSGGSTQADLDSVAHQVRELIGICQRVRVS
jgi:HPt (histidine-containing phosphotransfer) domain-containing protein